MSKFYLFCLKIYKKTWKTRHVVATIGTIFHGNQKWIDCHLQRLTCLSASLINWCLSCETYLKCDHVRVFLKNYLIRKWTGALAKCQEIGTKIWRKYLPLIFKSFIMPPQNIAHAYYKQIISLISHLFWSRRGRLHILLNWAPQVVRFWFVGAEICVWVYLR